MSKVVVAAIIFYKKKILITQRKKSANREFSLKYEFPGGKVKKNEGLVAALKREIYEELELRIFDIRDFFSYDYKYTNIKIKLHFFYCKILRLDFRLKVHENYRIINIHEIEFFDWLKADYKVIKKLKKNYYDLIKLK